VRPAQWGTNNSKFFRGSWVNLRLKGACIFWGKENAEKILMLRAFYKAGRWNVLKKMANSPLSLVIA
jgi:hypothetical protein